MVRGGERARAPAIAYLSSSGGATASHPSDEPGDSVLEAEVRDHLRSLAVDYAAAVDGRDPDLLRSLFTADAVLTVETLATGESRVRDGVAAIADIRGDNERSWRHGVEWLLRHRLLTASPSDR